MVILRLQRIVFPSHLKGLTDEDIKGSYTAATWSADTYDDDNERLTKILAAADTLFRDPFITTPSLAHQSVNSVLCLSLPKPIYTDISETLSGALNQLSTQGRRIKAMMKCINNLRYLEVESEVPLPNIYIVRD